MAFRAELLLAIPVCLINSSYTLRLLFRFSFFFFLTVLLCEKLDFCMEFIGQVYLPLISVWGGKVCVAHV